MEKARGCNGIQQCHRTVLSSMPVAIVVGYYLVYVSCPFFRDDDRDDYSDDDVFQFRTFLDRRNVGHHLSRASVRWYYLHGNCYIGVPRAALSEVDHDIPPFSWHYRWLLLPRFIRRRRSGGAEKLADD